MAKIKLEQLQADNILSTDILLPNGMVVLQAKTVITSSHLSRLAKVGIKEVEIYEQGVTLDSLSAENQQAIERKFSGYGDNELMNSIKDILLKVLK